MSKHDLYVNLPSIQNAPDIVSALIDAASKLRSAQGGGLTISRSFHHLKIYLMQQSTEDVIEALKDLGITDQTARHIEENSMEIALLKQRQAETKQQIEAIKKGQSSQQTDIDGLSVALEKLSEKYSGLTEEQRRRDAAYRGEMESICETYAEEISALKAQNAQFRNTLQQTVADMQKSIARGYSDAEALAKSKNNRLIEEIDRLSDRIRALEEEKKEAFATGETAAAESPTVISVDAYEIVGKEQDNTFSAGRKESKPQPDYPTLKNYDRSAFEIKGTELVRYTGTATIIKIPLGVTAIGDNSFDGCKNLISVTIPDSVVTIGKRAFMGCSKLTSMVIPDGVTGIDSEAFAACQGLESITIPDSVMSIGDSVFSLCYSLKSVVIPDGVESIGANTFFCCYKLESVVIPESVKNIGFSAFNGCGSLKSVIIPHGVTCIKSTAFGNCKSLVGVVIPENVTDIGDSAFNSCSSLKSVTIPMGVANIGISAFAYCKNLERINYGGTATQWKLISKSTGWDSETENYTVLCADGTVIKPVKGEIKPTEKNYPTLKNYDRSAFEIKGTELVRYIGTETEVQVPLGVTCIRKKAFYKCDNLARITLPDSVTTIRKGALDGCNVGTKIARGNRVMSVGEYRILYRL